MPNERSRAANEVAAPDHHHAPAELATIPVFRVLLEVAAVSFATVALLRFWNPLSFVRLYNEAISASFLLIAGLAILLTIAIAARLLAGRDQGHTVRFICGLRIAPPDNRVV